MKDYQDMRVMLNVLMAAFCVAAVQLASSQEAPAKATPNEAYDKIVQGSRVDKGYLSVYEKAGKVHFEIPAAILDKDILWYVEFSRAPAKLAQSTGLEIADKMVRFQRRGATLFVEGRSAALGRRLRETTRPRMKDQQAALDDSNAVRTILALPIAAEGPNGSVVVDATQMFMSNIADLPVAPAVGGGMIDPSRSYIERAVSYDDQVSIGASLTFATGTGSTTIGLTHSLVKLPEQKMMMRYYDDRVGIFNDPFLEFGSPTNLGSQQRSLVQRFRLEKKDPTAAVSEPVKPIVFFISREVPNKWRRHFKEAVESWQPAFEGAGFRRAIIAKDAPSEAEDPRWSPSDMRNSVIRWVESPVINAMGPRVDDPRTGEIISAHVVIWSDVVKIGQLWYFTMASGVDPRARVLPYPDDLTGDILRYAVAHEVGHAIGLRHNHLASTAYSIAQLRDPKFAAKYGSVGSIMSYGRFNYVAQPEDGLKPADLYPKIGDYDRHTIRWSYSPIPGAKTPEDELPTLNKWAEEADSNRWLQWGGESPRSLLDPRVQMQNIGSDRVEATRLGLLNLKRALDALPEGYRRRGEPMDDVRFLYEGAVGQWGSMLMSVLNVVGGIEERRSLDTTKPQWVRVPAAEQRRAVKSLVENALQAPEWLYPARILDTLYMIAGSDEIVAQQQSIVYEMLDAGRAGAMADADLLKANAEKIRLAP